MSVKVKAKQLVLSAVMATFCMPFQYAHATETIVVVGKRPGGPSVDDLRDAVDREEALRYGEWLESQMQPIDVVAVEITSLDTRCHPDGSQALSTDSADQRYQAAHDTFVDTTTALGVSRSNLAGKNITITYGDGGRETFRVVLSSTTPLVPVAGTVSYTHLQKLESKIQESSSFLSRISIVPVPELEAEKIGLGVSGPIASRTDTTNKDRQTSDISTLDEQKYRCEKTDSDTHVRYSKLDLWAKFPDFQAKLRDAIIKRQALDRMSIGFNGISVAANSNRATNPLLQDVNKGWLQHYREHRAGARVMKEVAAGSGKIKIGASISEAQGYKNIDALVFDLVANLIDPWHQENPDLIVICGRALLHDKYFPIVNSNHAPTEQQAADLIISQKRIGNLPAVRVPYFPPNALLVTTYENLSIYYQEGSRRRHVVDNPKRDQIENYESSNDAYVVEDFGAGAFAENIELVA